MKLAEQLLLGSARELADAVRSGDVRAVDVVDACAERIAATEAQVHAFTRLTLERARAEAGALDRRLRRADPTVAALPLLGVPFAVKDLYDVRGLRTTAGSAIGRTRAHAVNDAVLVNRMVQAGAVLVGTLNMDEYAYGFTTENGFYGRTCNPHDLDRIAGGSSGGSAAAVAAGQVPLSLGSDTNGSIRVPAGLCGVFGLKPTYGVLPRGGTFPLVDELDHMGPFARSADDLALVYDCLRGTPGRRAIGGPMRVAALGGWFEHHAGNDARAAVHAVLDASGGGDTVVLPGAEAARAAAFVLTNARAARIHLDELRSRPQAFSPATRDRLLAGAMLPSVWIEQALRFRESFAREVAVVFERYDVLVAPCTPCIAPLASEQWLDLEGQSMPVRASLGLLTQPISCIGLPVVSVPVWSAGASMPIGVQLIGAPHREAELLAMARQLEQAGVALAPVAQLAA